MRVLISGASVAGPTLAYWLARYGFDITVVERSPAARKSGGHAVDLFKPAMDIVEKMGVLDRIEAHKVGTDLLSIHREGKAGLVDLPEALIFSAVSQRHVEIMRDDLSEILYDASSPTAEYIFGDSIAALTEDDTGVMSPSNRARSACSISSSAPTDCTRTFAVWCSVPSLATRIGWASTSPSRRYPTTSI